MRRGKRQVDEGAVRRNLRKQNQALKEAACLSKQSKSATEYLGPLSRNTVVCYFLFLYYCWQYSLTLHDFYVKVYRTVPRWAAHILNAMWEDWKKASGNIFASLGEHANRRSNLRGSFPLKFYFGTSSVWYVDSKNYEKVVPKGFWGCLPGL